MNDMTVEKAQKYYSLCVEYAQSIVNADLRTTALNILTSYKDELLLCPATAYSDHHCYTCGLIKHMYNTTTMALQISDRYPDVKMDHGLIIFGSLLHDIGKIPTIQEKNALTRDGIFIDEALLGSRFYSANIVSNVLPAAMDHTLRLQAIHCVFADTRVGINEHEHPAEGVKMIEALVINFANSIDSYLEPAEGDVIANVFPGDPYKTINSPVFFRSVNA